MTKSEIVNAIQNIINSVENEDLIEVNGTDIGHGYKVVFDAIVGAKSLALAEELGEDAFDDFDIRQMEKSLERADDQLDTILKEVKRFATTNPSVGEWTRGGKHVRGDFGLELPFVYEVISDGVIKVA